MEYAVTDWRGHPNTHCPFCSYATVSENAIEQVDSHISLVHPNEVRQAAAAEVTAEIEAQRKAMNKEQLLELATSLEIEGLTMRDNRDVIEAAIAAKESETAADALVGPDTPETAATTAQEDK